MQHNLCRFEDDQDPWGAVLLKVTARRGCPWKYCSTVNIKRCATVLWTPGELEMGLFLVHSGKVALFTHIPNLKDEEWPSPVATYGFGWFINREFILGKPSKFYAVAIEDGQVLSWTNYQWWKMFSDRPVMAAEMMRAVHFQSTLDVGPSKWMAELEAANDDQDLAEQVEALKDVDESEVHVSKSQSLEGAMHYSDKHRAVLPQQLKILIDSFEVAESFGKLGAYDLDSNTELASLPPLPDWICEDLKVAFETHAMLDNGRQVIASDQTMAALTYAAIPRVFVAFSGQPFFTRNEFMELGHHAAMSRLPLSLDKQLRGIMADHRKKHDIDTLEPHHVADLLRSTFHRSFSTELVLGMVEEIGYTDVSDEEMFVIIFSRLLRHHEQYWNLLVAIKQAADPSKTDPKESVNVNTFTSEALCERLLNPKREEVSEEERKAKAETAAEMLWACDWPRRDQTSGKRWGEHLHVYDVAVAILSQLMPPSGTLAPPPITNLRTASKDGKAERQISGNDMSKFIVHLPSLAKDAGKGAEFKRISTKIGSSSGLLPPEQYDDEDDALKTKTLSQQEQEGPLSCRAKVHITLEDPGSSTTANVVSLLMGILIVMSILSMLVEPVTQHGREDDLTKAEEDMWLYLEGFTTVLFSIEYLVRLSVANALGTMTTVQFITTPANICDFMAIVPFYVRIAFGGEAQELRLLRVVRLLRLTRIARLGRLTNRNPLFPPIACVLLVIWFIYMKTDLGGSK